MDKYFIGRQGKAIFMKDYCQAALRLGDMPEFPCKSNVINMPYRYESLEIPFSPLVANQHYDCESSAAIEICLFDDGAWLSEMTLADISNFDDAMVTPFNAVSVIDHVAELLRTGNEEDESRFMKAGQSYTLYQIELGRCLAMLKKLVEDFMPNMTWVDFLHKRVNGIMSDRDDCRYRRVSSIKKVEDWSHLGIVRLDWLAGVVCDPKYSESENPIADFISKHQLFNNIVHCHKGHQEKDDKEAFNRAVFLEKVEGHGIDMGLLDTELLEDVCHFINVDHIREPKQVNKISKELKKIIKGGGNPNEYLYDRCLNVGSPESDGRSKVKAPVSMRREFVLFADVLDRGLADNGYGKDVLPEMFDCIGEKLSTLKVGRFGSEGGAV